MGQPASRLQVVAANPPQAQPKLLDRVRAAIRTRHYSIRTEEAYIGWIRRFILFHNKRHPAEMGESEINQFLSHLAVRENVAASTQNQALSAILFLYQEVLERDLDRIEGVVRAKKPARLPLVLTRDEVRALLERMSGGPKLIALLLYGAGLRLLEALRLRVKDIDLEMNQITVRDGKGQKDRITMLPATANALLVEHLKQVRRIHHRICGKASVECTCQMRLPESTRGLSAIGVGSMFSLPATSQSIHVQAVGGGTIWMNQRCSERSSWQ